MMSTMYGRRQAMKMGLGGLAGLATLGMAGCDTVAPLIQSGGGGIMGPAALQMVFWGSDTRNKYTRQAIDVFQKSHPGITIASQYKDFNSYWAWLDSSFYAKGIIPDLIQMDMRYVAQFVRQQKLLDLTQSIYNQSIDLSDYDPTLLDSSKVNNTIYGIPMGGNYQAWLYDKTALAHSGMGTPPDGATWDTFASYATELTKALGNTVYGSWDGSGDIASFEMWIRGRGKELYDHDGNVAFDLSDVVDWYNFWDKLRKSGGCPTMDISSKYDVSGQPTDASVVKGKVVFSNFWSNQLDAFQAATQHALGMWVSPQGTSSGMYLKASMLLSISSKTPYPEQAAAFINYINNNPDAIKALSAERGVPGSIQARTMLSPLLPAAQRTSLEYVNAVSKSNTTRVKLVLDPPGAGKVGDTLKKMSQDIGFGRTTVTDGSASLLSQAKQIVAQS